MLTESQVISSKQFSAASLENDFRKAPSQAAEVTK